MDCDDEFQQADGRLVSFGRDLVSFIEPQANKILRKPVLSLPKGHRHIPRRRSSTARSGDDCFH